MANQLFIPRVNPEKWVVLDPVEIPQYLTKHFDEYLLEEQTADLPWLEKVGYAQKWQQNDTIKMQMESNFDPINISLIDALGNTVLTVLAQNVRANKYMAGYYIFEAEMSLASVPEGCYYRKLEAGSPVGLTMISEPISIKEKHENTALYEYRNTKYHLDVIWETGIVLNMRVESVLEKYKPGGTKTVYEDENLNPTILKAKPFRGFQDTIGGEGGVPEWVIDKLNYIYSCNDVSRDGKSVYCDEDFDIQEEAGYPLKGCKIKVREGVNRNSGVYLSEGLTNERLIVVYNIERKLFGDVDGDGSNNTIPILGIE